MEGKTTIQVNKATLGRLKMAKQHPLESYDITINFLLDDAEAEIITEEEVEEIKIALDQVKRGKTIPFEEVLREANIDLDKNVFN
jgi:hypothetical protein